MNTPSRGLRFFWLLGFILLLGSVVGAGWFLNQPVRGTGPSAAAEPAMLGVVGLGYVDVEEGITMLHPVQAGRIQAVYVQEGDTVFKDQLLLSLDPAAAKLTLREAEADLTAAKQELADTQRQLTNDKKHRIAILEKKIEATRIDVDSAKKERNLYKKIQEGGNLSAEQFAVYENKVLGAEKVVEVLDATLAELRDIDVHGPVERLKAKVRSKKAQADLAHRAVVECDLYAPSDGVVLRLFAQPSEILTSQPRQPAIHFCPSSPRIVRAEILQEWASKIQKGQVAFIEDDTRITTPLKGKVMRVSDVFTHRRVILQEPFQFNDVRTLECIIQFDAANPPVRIGQRVRVTIAQ